MTPAEAINALALALRDVIVETPTGAGALSPEEAYRDLANRLVLRLHRKELTVAPFKLVRDAEQIEGAEAAKRTFDILTDWQKGHDEYGFATRLGRDGRIEIFVRDLTDVRGFFTGESIQDAYAQLATAIVLNKGEL